MTVPKRLSIELALLIIVIIFARLLVGIPLKKSLEKNAENFVKKVVQIPASAQKDFRLNRESWVDPTFEAKMTIDWREFSIGSKFEITIDSVIPPEKYGIKIGQLIPQETKVKLTKDQIKAIEIIIADSTIKSALNGFLSEDYPIYKDLNLANSDGLEKAVVHTSGIRITYNKEKIGGELGADYKKLKIFQPEFVSGRGISSWILGRNIIGEFIVQGFQFSFTGLGLFGLLMSTIPLLAFPTTFFIVKYSWFQRFILPEITFVGLFLVLTILSNFISTFIGIFFFSTG